MISYKSTISVLFCFSLVACSTTSVQTDSTVDQKPATEVKTEQPVVNPEPDVVVEKPVEVVEEKPEQKPQPLPTKTADGKLILGEQEWVFIPGLDKSFKARVDTGATTSSISAVDIVRFERDGKDWVKFKIEHDNISSNEISLPILRWAKVKQSGSEEIQKRPVVTAWIEIGDLKDKADFTLSDRNHLEFPVLLGRSFFRDVALVDIGRKFVQPKKK
ncbi:ATP-dependent zinc protease [Vibrio sp. 99-8-1]|uniref:ATP-dependent zinc protease family protein n=1 Tax=Vibrio sp. 99-8-1 TaxID=2607602 RepID=UPI00149364C5|nr:ATP-dependent zinc protease [Vibrio sp. 99-8-1]NOI67073.1 ATP-dependent zinc protease [Vibrio sp. 99-8-1]